MLNHIVLMGRLTRDPELRRTGSGLAVVSFSLAVDRDFGNRETGDRATDFIDIVAWSYSAPASNFGGYSAPAAPSAVSDFAMLEDEDDGHLPF